MTRPIEIKDLRKRFRVGLRRKRVDAVVDVSLEVEEGEIFGLIGPNGAGKTTTLKMLTGLMRPDGGTVKLFGQNAQDTSARRRLGYLPENPYFYEHLSARETLRFYGGLFGLSGSALEERIDELLEVVGLTFAADRRLKKFSKGMRQRTGLAQALINDPDLLILDEPQSGLDPIGRKEVRDLILDLKKRGKTLLFASHILPDVEAVCDRVAVIHEGRTIEVGALDELLDDTHHEREIICSGVDPALLPESARVVENRRGRLIFRIEGEEEVSEVLSFILDNGGEVFAVTPLSGTLEDVFIRDTTEAAS